jgi:hypothetical protein
MPHQEISSFLITACHDAPHMHINLPQLRLREGVVEHRKLYALPFFQVLRKIAKEVHMKSCAATFQATSLESKIRLTLATLLVASCLGCGGGSSSPSGGGSPPGPPPSLAAGYVTLYDFGSKTDDGYSPNGIVQNGSGVWYGTTLFGSSNAPQPPSNGATGTIFKFALGSGLAPLHSFTTAEGVWPLGSILGSDGNVYGAASEGGHGYHLLLRCWLRRNFQTDPAR